METMGFRALIRDMGVVSLIRDMPRITELRIILDEPCGRLFLDSMVPNDTGIPSLPNLTRLRLEILGPSDIDLPDRVAQVLEERWALLDATPSITRLQHLELFLDHDELCSSGLHRLEKMHSDGKILEVEVGHSKSETTWWVACVYLPSQYSRYVFLA